MVSIDETNLPILIKDKKVIIYGAHLIAVELYRYINNTVKVWDFSGFAVTHKEDNPEELENQKVRELKEYQADKNVIILVAMPEKYHEEVIEYAKARGFIAFACIGQSRMEAIKSGWILKNCDAEFKNKYELYEDLYDKSWLNIGLKENREDHKKADRSQRHYKFPTLYYLKMEQVWKEAGSFDYLKEYEKTFGTYCNLHKAEKEKLSSYEDINMTEILQLYMVFSQWDNGSMKNRELPSWIVPIQAGSILTDLKSDGILDESGDNISKKNRMFAEMTAAYWIWKNAGPVKYKGLCHYRRHFLLDKYEVMNFVTNNIDVILTTPRYTPGGIGQMFVEETPVKKPVYETMLQAVAACHPEDRDLLEQYMEQCLYCPNNMVIAKSEIYDAYCEWIFPILFRMEEMDEEKGYGHKGDRHIAYAAEILTSYYFARHKDEYFIAVTDYSFNS